MQRNASPYTTASSIRSAALTLFALLVAVATDASAQVTMAWSPVGNPGNAADPATGSLYGAVDLCV